MGQSIFDYETKTFLSILAISLIGMAIVVSKQPSTNNVFVSNNLFKQIPTNTFIVKNVDVGSFIGKDIPVLSKDQLGSLSDGKIVSSSGSTTYSQYLILQKSGSDGFNGGSVIFGRDDAGRTGNFLFFEKGSPLFEYALVFNSGLVSRVENNKLVDIENKYLNIMGESFVIVQTFVDVQQHVISLRLLGPDGFIDLADNNYGDNSYKKGVKVDGKQVGALFKISALYSSSNNLLTIREMRYQPLADTLTSSGVYVSANQGVRNRLRNSDAVLVKSFEMIYGGVSGASNTAQNVGGGEFVLLSPKGTSQYDLSFHNDLGVEYDVPLVNSEAGFKYGSQTENLVFVEGNNNVDFNINTGDYFVVNNKNDINGVTNIMKYKGVDYSSLTAYFIDVGTKDEKSIPFDPATGFGELSVSGNNYAFYVSLSGNHPIVVDQDGDGVIDGGRAEIVLSGGGRLDLGDTNFITGNTIPLSLITPKRLFSQPSTDEIVNFNIVKTNSNLDVVVPNQYAINMLNDNSGLDKGLTVFGVYFLRDGRSKTSSQLVIQYPTTVPFATQTAIQGQGAIAITLEREKYLRKQ